ncbi:hypothetical protein SNEBB_008314, partial [Seison nebaliae]
MIRSLSSVSSRFLSVRASFGAKPEKKKILDINPKKFAFRHLGVKKENDLQEMLNYCKVSSLNELLRKIIPENIPFITKESILVNDGLTEREWEEFFSKTFLEKNKVFRSFIGNGFYPSYLPEMIRLNILQNPSWYTAYTPYQSEISQGRLEALFNYQTLICQLTGLPLTNASLLDEASACVEAIMMSSRLNGKKNENKTLLIDNNLFSFNRLNIIHRCNLYGLKYQLIDMKKIEEICDNNKKYFALILQTPNRLGETNESEIRQLIEKSKIINIVVTDPLYLCLRDLNATPDIIVGSLQRFGMPMGFGGPSAAFLACQKEFQRLIPGRIVGESMDRYNRKAYRLAVQTREQHIRKEKATSNICTSQVLPAIISSFYALYHGNDGLYEISRDVHLLTSMFRQLLLENNNNNEIKIINESFFDSILLKVKKDGMFKRIKEEMELNKINLKYFPKENFIKLNFDECTSKEEMDKLLEIICGKENIKYDFEKLLRKILNDISISQINRKRGRLTSEIFHKYSSETQLRRYMKQLEMKDLSLVHSMIPLGSCTMKLNSAVQMKTLEYKEVTNIHPEAPIEQLEGYTNLINVLTKRLCQLTGYDHFILSPNSGAQGEYVALAAIRDYLSIDNKKLTCLIPESAHGTNAASATLAGYETKRIKCDNNGRISYNGLKKEIDLLKKQNKHFGVIMLTYPSTYGFFDDNITDVCRLVHENGAQVYLDGANLNAQIGHCRPGEYGADASHVNLHKTFCIPHGGGGPGVGPVGVKSHLKSSLMKIPITSSQFGSASILPISFSYIELMGRDIKKSTELAILNSNYVM